MPASQTVAEFRRFLGMANQLGRSTPRLAMLSKSLRELLQKNREWHWNAAHQKVFDSIKTEVSSASVLALYNPNHESCVSADASSFSLSAVISLKQSTGNWRPIAYHKSIGSNLKVERP